MYQTPVFPFPHSQQPQEVQYLAQRDYEKEADLDLNSPYGERGSHSRPGIGPEGKAMPKEMHT